MSNHQDVLSQLDKKYNKIDQDLDTHLDGLLHSKPITYWDYINTDALLSLQTQRTGLPDEMVFLMYHQVNELLFKMMLWELEQLASEKNISAEFFKERLSRVSRYFDMLASSFTVMQDGMDLKQYMKFRDTLTPASGYQSEQYRKIEFASTEIINLVDNRFRNKTPKDVKLEDAFEDLYWQAAGKDFKTGKKNYMLTSFEDRYKNELLRFGKTYRTRNLWSIFKALPSKIKEDKGLVDAMRHYDYTVNVTWVMAHYNAAKHYLTNGGEITEATGGSDWTKYMHPKYQRRIFFPELWSEQEREDWGKNL
ncbi:tryptophan 2,3-dioxygenase family protein [Aurantibacter sp.]|uniref:tryptophan 2,3-dioxygenase family protein n=1 Tax=Aurantibacter sp. TaxID=2807103 RepID=UPI0035C8101B